MSWAAGGWHSRWNWTRLEWFHGTFSLSRRLLFIPLKETEGYRLSFYFFFSSSCCVGSWNIFKCVRHCFCIMPPTKEKKENKRTRGLKVSRERNVGRFNWDCWSRPPWRWRRRKRLPLEIVDFSNSYCRWKSWPTIRSITIAILLPLVFWLNGIIKHFFLSPLAKGLLLVREEVTSCDDSTRIAKSQHPSPISLH